MTESTVAASGAWEVPDRSVSAARRNLGRAVIAVPTIALVAVAGIQLMHSARESAPGFANWRPVAYVYVLWAVCLGVGLVMTRGERGQRALFVLPALLFTLALVVFPTVFGFVLAFSSWNLSSTEGRTFNGFANLRQLFHDTFFWQSMLNMVYYALSVFVQYAIAFGLALLLNQEIHFRRFFRITFLLPFMLSPVAVSWMIGKSIMDARFGPLAQVLKSLGVQAPAFFDQAWPARLSVMAMDSWYSIPFMMILLLAGLQGLPDEVLEASKVDGATGWQGFWRIVFPIMLPVSITTIILRTIFELKLADVVINVTGGAPGGATDTVSSYIFRVYNDRSNVGYGTALAEFYLIVIILFLALILWLASLWLRKVR